MKHRRLLFSCSLIAGLTVGGMALTPSLHAQAGPEPQVQSSSQQEMPSKPNLRIFKTYTLKYIKPEELLKATRILLEDASYSDSMITVKIWQSQIPSFEEMLKKLDVEKKSIQFQAFAIIASRDPDFKSSEPIANKELNRVLDELKALWNFATYSVPGPTFLTVRENSGANNVKLVSNRPLNIVIANPKIGSEEPGKRTISIEQVMLTAPRSDSSDFVYLDIHDIMLKEKGYLVAGVSGYDSSKTALILVINAEIK